MAELDATAFWRSIVVDSEENSDNVFTGFLIEDIAQNHTKDESDVNFDVVVNHNKLLDSTLSDEEISGSDFALPIIAAPQRKKRRLTKQKRDEVTTRWSD